MMKTLTLSRRSDGITGTTGTIAPIAAVAPLIPLLRSGINC